MNSDKYFENTSDDDYPENGFYEAYETDSDLSEEELFDFIDEMDGVEEGPEFYPDEQPNPVRASSEKRPSAARPRKKKSSLAAGIIIAVCVIAILALAVFLGLKLMDENKKNRSNAEEDALVAITEEVRSDVAAGAWDSAMEKANSIHYTTGYSKEIEEKWDDIREKLIQYVENEHGLARNDAQIEAEAAAAAAAAAEEEVQVTLEDYANQCKEFLAADGYNVIIQDNTFYIGFWKTGYGDRALEAYELKGENLEAWDEEMESIRKFNREIRDSMRFNGFASYSVVFQLLNDIDDELTLVEFNNGVITYNAVH